MKLFSSNRRLIAAAALVLLVLFLVRPGASRLKSRIIASLGVALDRPVDLRSVHIRMLPRPGFDIENLVVYDDPAFGSEPMLRASEVTANLRLSSLLRGRLEVARLDLTEPSLNLVHHVGGGWNIESLLERTSHKPLAPTAKARSESRPGFPYIEGSSARINFKNGPEKKPYALTNADFSLWQESDNSWGVRLKAQPFRSDMNLNDTGELRVSGTWQRADKFLDTPLQFSIEWKGAQLGQVTKFVAGNDKGWRGDIQLDATVTGNPAELKISSTVSADDFRRYDITTGKSMRLAAHCDVEYATHEHEFRGIDCSAPIGAGLLTVKGEASVPGSHRYSLVATANDVPASALGALAQHAKRDLPNDLTVEGVLEGKVSIAEDLAAGSAPRITGRGQIADFHVASATRKSELGPQTIPFAITDSTPAHAKTVPRFHPAARLEFGPFAMEPSRPGGAAVRGWVDLSGYGFSILGEASITNTLRLAPTFGLRALNSTAEGSAQLKLQVSGSWLGQSSAAGFAGAQITGTAKLRNVRFGLRGAAEPVEILSAEMLLSPDEVRVGKLSANAAGTLWSGSMQMPRGCGSPETCPIRFQLNAEEIALNRIHEWINRGVKNRPWYRVLDSTQASSSVLSRIRASGRVTAERFVLHGVTPSRASANVNLDSGKAEIASINADLLGGKHRGAWQADFRVKPAVCKGTGNVSGVPLANLSRLMKDNWIEGSADASYEIQGLCAPDFWQSAEGMLQLDMADGSFPHVLLGESAERLRVRRFTAEGRLHSGSVEVSNGILNSPDGKFEISGTADFKQNIDLRITRLSAGSLGTAYSVGGTLAEPRVKQVGETEQARLKP